MLDSATYYLDNLEFDKSLNIVNDIITGDFSDTLKIRGYLKKGTILNHMHKEDLSLRSYQEAIAYSIDKGHDDYAAKGFWGLGNTYFYMDQIDSAILYWGRSVDFFKAVSDTSNTINLLINIGFLNQKLGNIDSSEHIYQEVLDLTSHQKDSVALGIMYGNISDSYRSNENYDKALEYALLGLKIEEEKGRDGTRLIRAHDKLWELYLEINNFEKAALHFKIYDSLSTDLLSQDYNDKILELETKFKTSEFEKDNALKQVQIESQERNLILLGSLAFIAVISILAIYVYNEQRKRNIRSIALKDQELKDQRIEELLNQQELKTTYALLEGQDMERSRIAKDLHDNISTTMVTMTMFLDSLRPKSMTPEESKVLTRVHEIAHQVTEDTRKLSHSLDSGSLKHFGLEVAIKDLLDAVTQSGAVTLGTLTLDLKSDLPIDTSLNIYRVLQELVNNTLKHAQSANFSIDITEIKNEYLTVIYEDDGVGFDTSSVKQGIGLRNIQSRIDNLGGTLTIDSRKRRNTTFIIEIPMKS